MATPAQAQITQTFHQGPIPAPEVMRQYDAILPGAAERIMRMAEIEGEHRRALERSTVDQQEKALKYTARDVLLGQIFALVICLAFIGLAIFLVLRGHPIGSLLSLPGIGGIVYTFIIGRSRQQKDDSKKS